MSNNTSSSGGNIGFAGALTILFIGLKLGNVINWPWLWVLSPLLISGLLLITFILLLIIVVVFKK